MLLLLSLAGALPVSAFFISALFHGYSPLYIGDEGLVLILAPLVVGILFGSILSEWDLRSVTFGTISITLLSCILIAVFIMSPILAGVAQAAPAAGPGEVIEVFVAQRVLLFVVLSFPVLLLGTIMGSALSDRLFPSEGLRQELERLRAETREWHEVLEKTGRAQQPTSPEAPSLGGEEVKTSEDKDAGAETDTQKSP